jgi:general secretion pathway protein A
MYLDHYKLQLKPFQISTDPKFLYLGEKHQEALAVLKYGIQDNKGFLLLTGDVGTGKTTLINALVDSLAADVFVAMVPDPGLEELDFFNFVADSFGIDKRFDSKGEFLIFLRKFLLDLNRQGKQALLIIDECQHLDQNMLEEIRLLSNIEKAETKLINIFFVGQSEFNDIILRRQNRAMRQRVTINYNISALSEKETDEYIRFRLDIAGAVDTIFTPRAIEEVYNFSNGYPRLINIICDQSLLTGFVKERRHIDEQIVAECANELKIKTATHIDYSDAIPESRDAEANNFSFVNRLSDLTQRYVRIKKPLMAALVLLFIIWAGLITTYLLHDRPSDAIHPPTEKTEATVQPPGDRNIAETRPNREEANRPPDADTQNQTNAHTTDTLGAHTEAQNPSAADEPPIDEEIIDDEHIAVDESLDMQRVLAMLVSKISEEAAPEVTLETLHAKFGVYPEVHFDLNDNDLNEAAYDVLGMVSQYCLQNPESIVILRGYTDKSGLRTYNMKLSEFRANMVKTYLVGKGVKDDTISTIAMGPSNEGPGGIQMPKDSFRRKVVIEVISPTN